MGQAASITINDGTATPVAVTFHPEFVSPQRTVFVDRRKGVSALQPRISVGFDSSKPRRKTNHADFSVTYPLEGLVNGVAAVVDIARYERGRFILPDGMGSDDRKHLSAFVRNGLANALIKNVFENLDPIY